MKNTKFDYLITIPALGYSWILITNDIVLVSPYATSIFNLAVSGTGGVATAYAERKRRDRKTETACQAQNMDFEPIVFEIIGSYEMGARRFLKNIYQECDRATNSPLDTTKQDLKIRFSIDIQRGLSQFISCTNVALHRRLRMWPKGLLVVSYRRIYCESCVSFRE